MPQSLSEPTTVSASPVQLPISPGPRQPRVGGDQRIGVIVAAAAALVAVGLIGVMVASGGSDDPPVAEQSTSPDLSIARETVPPTELTTTSTTAPPLEFAPTVVRISASATAPGGVDSSGAMVSYSADHLADGDASTAWRVEGDGIGSTITIDLENLSRVATVGLLPGYDKIDAADGVDRWSQNRRPTVVRWEFDDGTRVLQELDDDRRLQVLDVDVRTRRVTLTIIGSTSIGERDFTAISELRVA